MIHLSTIKEALFIVSNLRNKNKKCIFEIQIGLRGVFYEWNSSALGGPLLVWRCPYMLLSLLCLGLALCGCGSFYVLNFFSQITVLTAISACWCMQYYSENLSGELWCLFYHGFQ